jgi:hypothetical protein
VAVNQVGPPADRPADHHQNKPSVISSVCRVRRSLSLPRFPFLPYPPPPLRAAHRRPHPYSTPATHSPPPTDSLRLRQDLGAGVQDLRPVLALAVRSGWRWAPSFCRAAYCTIWDLGGPPPGPSLPRRTSRGRQPKEEQQQPAQEDVLHGALDVGLTS